MVTRWLRSSAFAEIYAYRPFRLVLALALAGAAMWLTMQAQGQHWTRL